MSTPVYRERRRLAKLRRRARDRDVRARLAMVGVQECGRGPGARTALVEWEYLHGWPGSWWWATAEGRRAWLEADRTVKLASKWPPLSVMRWAADRGYPPPWGSDVIAAYKEHIRAAEALCRAGAT